MSGLQNPHSNGSRDATLEWGTREYIRLFRVAFFFFVVLVALQAHSFATKQPKTYPLEGKIVGTGVNQLNRTRTYRVVTDARTYELDCGKHPEIFSRTPGECGGEKKLQIGDVIHFRIDNGKAYIPVPETVEASGEQKMRILREELRPQTKPTDATEKSGEQKP